VMCKSVRIFQRSNWGYEDIFGKQLTYQHQVPIRPQFYTQKANAKIHTNLTRKRRLISFYYQLINTHYY